MAECARCNAYTQLFENGVPICLKCAEDRQPKLKPQNGDQIRTTLVSRIAQATARVSEVDHKFSDAIGELRSSLPRPDGVQQIKNVSHELAVARKEMMTAQRRLSDFADRGIVPDDLKRTG
jgi:hypothetical protein